MLLKLNICLQLLSHQGQATLSCIFACMAKGKYTSHNSWIVCYSKKDHKLCYQEQLKKENKKRWSHPLSFSISLIGRRGKVVQNSMPHKINWEFKFSSGNGCKKKSNWRRSSYKLKPFLCTIQNLNNHPERITSKNQGQLQTHMHYFLKKIWIWITISQRTTNVTK